MMSAGLETGWDSGMGLIEKKVGRGCQHISGVPSAQWGCLGGEGKGWGLESTWSMSSLRGLPREDERESPRGRVLPERLVTVCAVTSWGLRLPWMKNKLAWGNQR